MCFFALDAVSWARPRSRVWKDVPYVHHASSDGDGGAIPIGYPYAALAWGAEAHTRWSLPVDVQRIPGKPTAQDVGGAQMQALAKARAECTQALDSVAADGKYGNGRFVSRVSGVRGGMVARLRSDRVFYRPAEPTPGKRGLPSTYGERFAFKDEQTWGTPDEVQEFQDKHYGKVRPKRWNGLRDKRAPSLTCDLVRAATHREQEKPPHAVWFAWLSPLQPPTAIAITAQTIWFAYVNRWPMEPGVRFRNETLGWTFPRFQSAEAGDTWTWLVALAHWMRFLARPVVQDRPLPWQKAQSRVTPQRVRQSLGAMFLQIGTPARPPKPRGKSPGWPKGRPRTPKERHQVVKKGVSATQTA
jgi:hypothetical protein